VPTHVFRQIRAIVKADTNGSALSALTEGHGSSENEEGENSGNDSDGGGEEANDDDNGNGEERSSSSSGGGGVRIRGLVQPKRGNNPAAQSKANKRESTTSPDGKAESSGSSKKARNSSSSSSSSTGASSKNIKTIPRPSSSSKDNSSSKVQSSSPRDKASSPTATSGAGGKSGTAGSSNAQLEAKATADALRKVRQRTTMFILILQLPQVTLFVIIMPVAPYFFTFLPALLSVAMWCAQKFSDAPFLRTFCASTRASRCGRSCRGCSR